jgi:hypothetical protein
LLYLHTAEEPIILREFLLKATGKYQVGWDDLLQYLEEDITLRETVKKIEHCPISATEVVDNSLNDFGKLVSYIKLKETNVIQSVRRLPAAVAGENMFLVCMDKELVMFDFERKAVLNAISFKYSKMKEKIFEREEQRRLQREKTSQDHTKEYLDKVEIINLRSSTPKGNNSQLANRFLTSNFKNSVRASSMSSEKSNDRMVFRKHTESGEAKRRNKSHQIKIKNNDIDRIFEIFEHASIQNSIAVAHAFTEARNNFHKNIVLDKSVLEQEKQENSYGTLSDIYHNNYQKELKKMRGTSLRLNRMRAAISLESNSRGKSVRRGSLEGGAFFREDGVRVKKEEEP